MKKIFAIILALTVCLLSGCGGNTDPTSTPTRGAPSTGSTPSSSATDPTGSTPSTGATVSGDTGSGALDDMTLHQIVDAIYAIDPVELMVGTIDVDLTDSYAVNGYLGLDSADAIEEAVASESMFGAQAYSLVLCRVKDAANAQSVAQAMRSGIDQRKWVCVIADDIRVSASGDVVMLIMISSEYASSATAQSLTDAFRQVAGGSLSTEIG